MGGPQVGICSHKINKYKAEKYREDTENKDTVKNIMGKTAGFWIRIGQIRNFFGPVSSGINLFWIPNRFHAFWHKKYPRQLYALKKHCLFRLLGDWNKGIEIGAGEENFFFYSADKSSQGRKKFLVPARQAQQTNQGRTPFICSLWVPIRLSFNCQ